MRIPRIRALKKATLRKGTHMWEIQISPIIKTRLMIYKTINNILPLVCRNPPEALYGAPVDHGDSRYTYVENTLCIPYFNKYHGCSVCVAVCPFNHAPYEKIKKSFVPVKI